LEKNKERIGDFQKKNRVSENIFPETLLGLKTYFCFNLQHFSPQLVQWQDSKTTLAPILSGFLSGGSPQGTIHRSGMCASSVPRFPVLCRRRMFQQFSSSRVSGLDMPDKPRDVQHSHHLVLFRIS
jgi:hypothetical protein